MFQNNEAFAIASLAVIGIATLGSKVVFRKSAAVSGLLPTFLIFSSCLVIIMST